MNDNGNWIAVRNSYHVSQSPNKREAKADRYSMRTPPRQYSNNVWRADNSQRRGSMSPRKGTWVMDVPNRSSRNNFNQRYARIGRTEDSGATCGGDLCNLI